MLSDALANLADHYEETGRLKEALEVGEEAWSIARESLGDDHVYTALARVRLSEAQGMAGDHAGSEEGYLTSLPVIERLGRDHSQYLKTYNNYAILLHQQEKYAEAEAVYREILEIRLDKYGEYHEETANTLQNLAAMLKHQRQYDEAELALERARRIYSEVLRPGHPLTGLPLLTRSEIQLERGDFVGAEASAEEAAGILHAALPEGHFATAVAECRWGRALAGQERTAEAEARLVPAVEDLSGTTQQPKYVAECENALAELRARNQGP